MQRERLASNITIIAHKQDEVFLDPMYDDLLND